MPSPEEVHDLETMKAAREQRQLTMYNFMVSLSTMTAADLKNCGFKSLDEGIVYAFKSAKRDIDRLHAAHLKKWPD